MKKRCFQMALVTCLFCIGCIHPFWNPAGAKGIRFDEFQTIYYQTNTNRTKAYLFFSQPKLWIVGMSLSTRGDQNVRQWAISFGGVRDTEANRKKYVTLTKVQRQDNLWMMEFEIIPGQEQQTNRFEMYYETKSDVWGMPLPYRGTREEFP